MSKTLTTGTPWRVIVVFAIPLLIGNVVQQLYQVVDAMVVGQNLGVNPLAAVGTTGAILFLLMGFAWGMTTGFAIPTAQAFGAGDFVALRRSIASGTALTAIASLLVTVLGVTFSRPLLQLLQTPESLLNDATTFAVVSFWGTTATMFFNYLSAIIRAIGDSRTPLIFLVISCAVNVALVILMVKYLHLGIAGAAGATIIAQACSVALCLIYVRRAIPVLHMRRNDWRINWQGLSLHLRLGLPMGFQASIIAIGTLAVQIRLNLLGEEAVAAYTTATRVDGLANAFLASLGLAASTFVAQNYGAGLYERVRVGTRQCAVVASIVAVTVAVLLISCGDYIIHAFVGRGNSEVVSMAHYFLVVNGLFYIVLGILFVTRGALQGLGRVLVPTLTGVLELFLRVAAATILGGTFGFAGVTWANPLAWVAAVCLLIPAWLVARRHLNESSVRLASVRS